MLATLIRLVGDFDLAEEALHDAFRAALEQWPRDGVPANPRAWLVSTGRFKAIDGLRRRARLQASLPALATQLAADASDSAARDDEAIQDDRLRLVFTCCHPALSPDAQVAMTLREVCGLTTDEIAHAFLATPPTVAQRIVRAEAKIRDARIPYVERALSSPPIGPYTLQAAIAAVHAEAPHPGATDWRRIVGLYGVLMRVDPSPVVELNRPVAVAMCDG